MKRDDTNPANRMIHGSTPPTRMTPGSTGGSPFDAGVPTLAVYRGLSILFPLLLSSGRNHISGEGVGATPKGRSFLSQKAYFVTAETFFRSEPALIGAERPP